MYESKINSNNYNKTLDKIQSKNLQQRENSSSTKDITNNSNVKITLSNEGIKLLNSKPLVNDPKVFKSINDDKRNFLQKIKDKYFNALVNSPIRRETAIKAYEFQKRIK